MTASPTMASSNAIKIVYVNIVLYAMAHWICVPVMPFMIKKLDPDPVMFGYIQTFSSLAQLIGGPLLGWVVDVKGARAAMSIGQVSGGLYYGLLAISWTVPMLFLAKIPTIFQHCLQAAQMCITLMSSEEERPKMIARLSFYYGLGFVCGPFIGGQLSSAIGENGNQAVALLAAFISLFCVILNFKFLPPLLAKDLSSAGASTSEPGSDQEEKPASIPKAHSTAKLYNMLAMVLRPHLRDLLLFSLLVGTALSSFYTSFALSAEPRFGMNAKEFGTAMSVVGGLSMVVNALVIPYINKTLSQSVALFSALALLSLAFVGLSMADELLTLYASLIPLVLSMAVFRAYSVSLVSAAVPKEEAGSAIGLAHAASSLSGVVAPTISGFIFREFGFGTVCLAQAALVVLAAMLLHLKGFGISPVPKKSE